MVAMDHQGISSGGPNQGDEDGDSLVRSQSRDSTLSSTSGSRPGRPYLPHHLLSSSSVVARTRKSTSIDLSVRDLPRRPSIGGQFVQRSPSLLWPDSVARQSLIRTSSKRRLSSPALEPLPPSALSDSPRPSPQPSPKIYPHSRSDATDINPRRFSVSSSFYSLGLAIMNGAGALGSSLQSNASSVAGSDDYSQHGK